jgi:hypothetical protein
MLAVVGVLLVVASGCWKPVVSGSVFTTMQAPSCVQVEVEPTPQAETYHLF